jgi:hypothetical protein
VKIEGTFRYPGVSPLEIERGATFSSSLRRAMGGYTGRILATISLARTLTEGALILEGSWVFPAARDVAVSRSFPSALGSRDAISSTVSPRSTRNGPAGRSGEVSGRILATWRR